MDQVAKTVADDSDKEDEDTDEPSLKRQKATVEVLCFAVIDLLVFLLFPPLDQYGRMIFHLVVPEASHVSCNQASRIVFLCVLLLQHILLVHLSHGH